MSAKNGWKRLRPLAGVLLLAMLCSAVLASVASAKKPAPTPTQYIALGDSLSFGYKAKTFNENKAANKAHCEAGEKDAEAGETEAAYAEKALCEPASSFEPGFVGYFGKKVAAAEKKAGNALTTLDLGCPGETSDGLIGYLLGGSGAEYYPCPYYNLLPSEGYPLKVAIPHGTSQLEAAISLITTKAAGETKVVSLQIGSNDELHVLGKCENNSYDAEHGFTSILECAEHEAGPEGYAYEGGLIHHIVTNLGEIIGTLRSSEGADYQGEIVLIGFYNPYATILPGSDKLVKALNEYTEELAASEENVVVAQPFPLINPEATLYTEGESQKEFEQKIKKENAAICKYTEMCPEEEGKKGKNPSAIHGDIHPTKAGYTAIGKLMVAAYEGS